MPFILWLMAYMPCNKHFVQDIRYEDWQKTFKCFHISCDSSDITFSPTGFVWEHASHWWSQAARFPDENQLYWCIWGGHPLWSERRLTRQVRPEMAKAEKRVQEKHKLLFHVCLYYMLASGMKSWTSSRQVKMNTLTSMWEAGIRVA